MDTQTLIRMIIGLGMTAVVAVFADARQRTWLDSEPCTQAMQAPLKLDINTPLQEISTRLTESRQTAGDFILTDDGYYLGTGRWMDLLRIITEMQDAAPLP